LTVKISGARNSDTAFGGTPIGKPGDSNHPQKYPREAGRAILTAANPHRPGPAAAFMKGGKSTVRF
jgi:hypothetical protein